MSEPTPIIACVPYNAPGYTPGQDYTVIRCPKCNRRCWIGPEGRKLRAGGTPTFCSICVIRGGGRKTRALNAAPYPATAHVDDEEMRRGLERIDPEDLG